MEHACHFKRWKIVGLKNNLLNKEWGEIRGTVYIPSAVTGEPKVHGITPAREATTTGGRGDRIRGTRGYPYAEESEVGAEIGWGTGVLGF